MNNLEHFNYLYQALAAEHIFLRSLKMSGRAYVADVKEVMEKDVAKMKKGLLSLNVTHFHKTRAIEHCLQAWRHYVAATGSSTRYAKHYGGFICNNDEHVLAVINRINHLKDEIKACVQDLKLVNDTVVHGRNHAQKHAFIHHALPGVITNQLYRHIPIIDKHTKGLSYYWTSKSVPKRMDKSAAKDFLKLKYENKYPSAELTAKLQEIDNTTNDVFEIKRVHQSVLMASLYDGHKQHNIHCTIPVVLTDAAADLEHNIVPKHIGVGLKKITTQREGQLMCSRTKLHGYRRIKDEK